MSGVSEPFIKRPVATTLLMFGLTLVGLAAFTQLPVAALPQVDYPTIVVSTYLPGGGAEALALAVTTPLTRRNRADAVSHADDQRVEPGLLGDHAPVRSRLEHRRRTAGRASGHQRGVELASEPASHPADLLEKQSRRLTHPDAGDKLGRSSPRPSRRLRGLDPRAKNLAGLGRRPRHDQRGQKPAVRVQVDPQSLAGAGLTLEDIRSALAAANVNQPKGNIDGPRQDYALATNDQLYKADGFKPLVIAYANGSPVRLQDVAHVIDGVEDDALAGWANGKPALILNVKRQPGANIIAVVDAMKELLPSSQRRRRGLSIDIAATARHHPHRRLRRPADTRDHGGAGHPRHLPLSAKILGDAHSQRHLARNADRHLRRDGRLGLQPRQSFADGAEHRVGIHRRRRHRHDREYCPLHRSRRTSHRCRAQGIAADRLHDRVADHLAGRRLHSAFVDGRHRRPPVSRILDYPFGRDRHLRHSVADFDAHDVRDAAQAAGCRRRRLVLSKDRAGLRRNARSLRSRPDLVAAPQHA